MKNKRLLIGLLVGASISIVALVIFFKSVYSVPVLMYHSINDGSERSRLVVSPQSFEKQMRFLKNRGYQALTLDEYAQMLKNRQKPKRKSIVVTFDDGFKDNFTNAYPVLKKYNIPAVIFVIVDWIGKENMMNWQQIKELSDSGLIEIGSHGMKHCELPKEKAFKILKEIKQSKRLLENNLKKKVNYMCYPCGFYNQFIKEIVSLTGYKGACATHPGAETALDDVYAIRRIRISGSADNLFIFWIQVSGYYNFLRDRKIKNK